LKLRKGPLLIFISCASPFVQMGNVRCSQIGSNTFKLQILFMGLKCHNSESRTIWTCGDERRSFRPVEITQGARLLKMEKVAVRLDEIEEVICRPQRTGRVD